MSLGVDPPKTNDDVPRAIEVLEGKKKEFEERRDKAAVEPPSEEVSRQHRQHIDKQGSTDRTADTLINLDLPEFLGME